MNSEWLALKAYSFKATVYQNVNTVIRLKTECVLCWCNCFYNTINWSVTLMLLLVYLRFLGTRLHVLVL